MIDTPDNGKMLDALRTELRGIKEQLAAIAEHQRTRHNESNAPPVIRAEVNTVEPVKFEEYPRDKHKSKKEVALIVLEVATVAAAVWIGILTLYQYRETRKATQAAQDSADAANKAIAESGRQFDISQKSGDQSFKDTLAQMKAQTSIQQRTAAATESNVKAVLQAADVQAKVAEHTSEAIRDQLRQEQRAWITLELAPLTLADIEAGKWPTYSYKNIGKTAAMPPILARFMFVILDSGTPPSLNFDTPHLSWTVGTIFPGQMEEDFIPRIGPSGEIIPVSRGELADLTTGRKYVVAYATISYRDRVGVEHWVKRCGFRGFGPLARVLPTRRCSDYNGIDNN
jgi:hypothetical protein